MKPLYLNSNLAKRIELEGESLKIILHNKTQVRFPLERISRIVMLGFMQCNTRVMIACCQQGIPIMFANKADGYAGLCMGKISQDAMQYYLQEQTQQVDNRLFVHWFENQQQLMLRRVAKALQSVNTYGSACALKNDCCDAIAWRYYCCFWQHCIEQLRPILTAHIAEILHHQHIDLLALYYQPTNLDLLGELSRLLEWELWIKALQGNLPKQPKRKYYLDYYAQYQQYIEQRTMQWLGQLWRCITENHQEYVEYVYD